MCAHMHTHTKQALNAPYGKATFSQINSKRKKSPQQMFPKADPLALDLLMKLLRYDPSERLTTAEALQHPFLAPFMGDAAPMSMDVEVKTPFDDNQRLTIKDYRTKLYAEIKQQRFVRAPSPTSPEPALSSHRSVTASNGSSAAYAVPQVPTQHAPQRRTAAKPALVPSYATSTYAPRARAAGSGSHRAAHEDQSELDALKALSRRTPRNPPQPQPQHQHQQASSGPAPVGRRERENVHRAANQPSHQRQPYSAWTGGAQQNSFVQPPARVGGFTDMQSRVNEIAKESSSQLMDIYGSPVKGGASTAGFNKRNQSSVFSSDGDATVRPASASDRPARSSGGWRAGRPPVGTTNIYRESTLAQGLPRGGGRVTNSSSVSYGALRQSQRGYNTPW